MGKTTVLLKNETPLFVPHATIETSTTLFSGTLASSSSRVTHVHEPFDAGSFPPRATSRGGKVTDWPSCARVGDGHAA